MKLIQTNIKNFRSIQSCVINHNKVSALVGKNNSGKSAVLRALNAFFNYKDEEYYFITEAHQYSSSSLSRIELTFINVPDKDLYHKMLNGNELIIRMTYSRRTKKRTLHYKKNSEYNTLSDSFIERLSQDITYVLIPIDRDNSEVVWNENSLLKMLLEEYLQKSTAKRDNLTPKVKQAAKELERAGLHKIQDAIEKNYSLNKNFKFIFSFDSEIDYTLLLNDITIEIEEKGLRHNITESGSGIKSLTIIAMYRYLAELRHTNIMLGIEEPEINLHPQAQREFVNSLKENSNGIESQIIFTTHSSVIVDQLEHEEIVLFRKTEDKTRGFKTVINQIPKDFFVKNDLIELKYYQFYGYKNSEFFFANFVIIVESKNDAEMVKFLMRKENVDLDSLGISIIDLGGVKNLGYPLYLLNYLSIPKLIIVDKDFFLPYLNDELKLSRNNNGFPKYRYEYKREHLKIIKSLIPNKIKREKLLELFKKNHSEAMNLLEEFNIISMNFCLEMDLIGSMSATKEFYNVLNIQLGENDSINQKKLLVERNKAIKKIENLLGVINNLQHKNLPNSYKRIKKVIGDIVKTI